MTEIRRESKLRERLQATVDQIEYQIQDTDYYVSTLRQQMTDHYNQQHTMTTDGWENIRAGLQLELERNEDRANRLRHDLYIAVHELDDFEDMCREDPR